MLSKDALEIVLDPGPGFYSLLFLVEKVTGGWRPVIDLSHLNEFVRQIPFKMETDTSVFLSVRKEDFLASIDLKDAYFQIPVLGRVSVGVGCTPPRPGGVRDVVRAGEIAAHQSSRIESIVFGIAVISGVGCRVTAMCDNSTVVAYVNKQGGTVSRSLCSLASQLLRWTESLDVHLDARYLPGQSNVLADLLSRR